MQPQPPTLALSAAGNPIVTCPACRQTDDHPRHIVVLGDQSEARFHHDCHALMGCEVCLEQTRGLAKGAIGEKMRAHLQKTGPGPDRPGWTAPSAAEVHAAAGLPAPDVTEEG